MMGAALTLRQELKHYKANHGVCSGYPSHTTVIYARFPFTWPTVAL